MGRRLEPSRTGALLDRLPSPADHAAAMGEQRDRCEVATVEAAEDRVHLLPRLLRGDASEILSRLADGDPLRLYELASRRAREAFLLFDADRLFERLAARVAHAGAQARPAELGMPWLLAQVDQLLARLIEEEREEERLAPFACPAEDRRYPFLRSLWVEPRYTRAASLAFNTLRLSARQAFFWFFLEKRSVEETLAMGSWTKDELMRDCWRAIGALGLHDLSSPPDPEWQLVP